MIFFFVFIKLVFKGVISEDWNLVVFIVVLWDLEREVERELRVGFF